MTELRQRQPVVRKPKRLSRAEKEAMELFREEVLRLDEYRCIGATDPEHECEGPLEVHHAIRQQTIRAHISTLTDLTEEQRIDWLWSPLIAVTVCHELHRGHTIRLRRIAFERLPTRVVEHCAEREVTHLLLREHPPSSEGNGACSEPITHPID